MTREQQIDIATLEFVSAMCRHCAIKADCNDVDAYCTEHDAQELGFTAGANWADEHPINVWHDTNEEPRLNQWFLAQIGDNAYDTFVMEMDKNGDWKEWSNGVNIKRWAYISDLLSKGGEK